MKTLFWRSLVVIFIMLGFIGALSARHADNCFSDFSGLGGVKRLAANG